MGILNAAAGSFVAPFLSKTMQKGIRLRKAYLKRHTERLNGSKCDHIVGADKMVPKLP
jgi:hypothetical protein